MYPILYKRVEFKEKKKSKKGLVVVSIIVSAVVAFSYLNIGGGLLGIIIIIGYVLYNDWVIEIMLP